MLYISYHESTEYVDQALRVWFRANAPNAKFVSREVKDGWVEEIYDL